MMSRLKKRKQDEKEAKVLKEKGNMCLKKGLFKSAIKHYSDALEIKKDFMVVYTNRALGRTKIEDWQGAIDDCTRVLEYCEVFEDGFEKSKDLCYKAFTRRAIAFRGQRNFKLAKLDLEEALKLLPD